MTIPPMMFTALDWAGVEPTRHPGDRGEAIWRTVQTGPLRVRMVEYSPGYVANHWCDRGHILHVIEGSLLTVLKDGREFPLDAGMSYQVSDFGDAAHRSSSPTGAKLFIVDFVDPA